MHSADRHPHRLETDTKISRELRRTKIMPYIAFVGISAAVLTVASNNAEVLPITTLAATVAAGGALYAERRYTEKRINNTISEYKKSLGIWSDPYTQTTLSVDKTGTLQYSKKEDPIATSLDDSGSGIGKLSISNYYHPVDAIAQSTRAKLDNIDSGFSFDLGDDTRS